jgi:hypothetical protein
VGRQAVVTEILLLCASVTTNNVRALKACHPGEAIPAMETGLNRNNDPMKGAGVFTKSRVKKEGIEVPSFGAPP